MKMGVPGQSVASKIRASFVRGASEAAGSYFLKNFDGHFRNDTFSQPTAVYFNFGFNDSNIIGRLS
jgi:hypothetical protein